MPRNPESPHAVVHAIALAVAWLGAFRAPLLALIDGAPRNAALIDGALALGLLALLVRHLARGAIRPVLRPAPLAVVALATGAHVVNAHTIEVDLLGGVCMVVGAWGLLGLHVTPRRWLQAMPLLLAGLCVLPVGSALDLYVGFPLRLGTAQITWSLLAPWIPTDLATETILVVEGGAAGVQIDLPCSGVRSLWSGAVFWAAASWIERVRVGRHWWLAGGAFAAILVATNVVRVVALTLLHAFAPPVVSGVLHVPLGLVAFVVACAVGFVLIRWLPKARPEAEPAGRPWSTGWLTVALLVVAAIPAEPSPRSIPSSPTLGDDWATPVALAASELALFTARGATSVGKWDVVHGRVTGQLLLVRSRSWRAQHRPDVCHAASGRRVEDDRTVMIDAEFPARLLRLSVPDGAAWGLYWFQSSEAITDDHDARVWSALDGDAEPWVMVSLVLDASVPASDPDVLALLGRARAAAADLVRTHPTESPP